MIFCKSIKINLNLLIEKYNIYIPADCPNGFEFNYLSKRFEALNEENNKNQFIRDNFEKFIRKYQIELRNQIESSLETDSIQEIQKKYLQSCNIVGMSCNANPNLLNDLEIQSFDVCIIDEVSKASFPELLLAFKISKKVVLVGDHRQLPPVFNEKIQSYKELMDHQSEGESESLITIENFKKFEKMIKNSFFKLSFENADERMKENLNVQFRMHVEIMNIVNQFYENTLLSGYTKEESDRIKDHKITIKGINNIELISPQKHVVWLDSSKEPNGNRYYETQNGTSKENHLEAAIIVNLLIKLNNEYSKLGFDEKRRKEVGVISFYGKQIGLLRKIVDKNKLKSLDIDINTVDKFQGKEKPIIIVSIVRNLNISKSAKIYNPEKPSHIAEYERINVAFSRAQELLIITGSKDMLYDYEVPLPELSGNKVNPKYVYKNILNSINYAGNLFESNSILTSEDFKLFCGKIPGANPGKKNLNGRKM